MPARASRCTMCAACRRTDSAGAARALLAREGIPRWLLAEALDQEIDEDPRLCREIAVGRIKRVDAELGRRRPRQHQREPLRRDVETDDESREVGDTVAGERSLA